jgi:hypothetical protein
MSLLKYMSTCETDVHMMVFRDDSCVSAAILPCHCSGSSCCCVWWVCWQGVCPTSEVCLRQLDSNNQCV